MKFYIGSDFRNAQLVNDYSGALKKNGWEHTYNWTKHINGTITMEALTSDADNCLRKQNIFKMYAKIGRS